MNRQATPRGAVRALVRARPAGDPLGYPPRVLYPLDGVRKSFGTKDVLKGAAWQHDPGRIVGTGIHHVCLEVDDVNLVVSVHPASTGGILLDLSQEMEG